MPILSLGGIGVISVLANIKPELVHNLVFEYKKENCEQAKQMQLESLPLTEALFCEVNPIPIKEALNINGFKFGAPRLPLVKASEKARKKLLEAMQR